MYAYRAHRPLIRTRQSPPLVPPDIPPHSSYAPLLSNTTPMRLRRSIDKPVSTLCIVRFVRSSGMPDTGGMQPLQEPSRTKKFGLFRCGCPGGCR